MGCGKKQCRDSNASRSIDRIGLGHSHDGDKWIGSGARRKASPVCFADDGALAPQTSVEAIHDELSTRKLEWEQLSLPI